MMMVDTINPNTDEPDAFVPPVAPPLADSVAASSDHFYGGFDRPDEVKINLAGTVPGVAGENAGPAFAVSPQVVPDTFSVNTDKSAQPAAFADSLSGPTTTNAMAPGATETQLHASYAKKGPVNTRGLVAIIGIGLLVALLGSTITYFIAGSSNSKKLSEEQTKLDDITNKLTALSATPDPLQPTETLTPAPVPVVTPEPTANPVVTPAPVETPVVAPATTVPAKTGENSAGAAG